MGDKNENKNLMGILVEQKKMIKKLTDYVLHLSVQVRDMKKEIHDKLPDKDIVVCRHCGRIGCKDTYCGYISD